VADLMWRAFDIDVLTCPHCDGRLRLITTVEDPDALFRDHGRCGRADRRVERCRSRWR